MDAIVIFKIGDIEIKTTARTPEISSITQREVRDHLTINNALTKLNKTIGLDLWEIDENIKEKAKVYY